MYNIDREALAWAAGFFDGEGHTSTTLWHLKDKWRSWSRTISLVWSQNDLRTLEKLKSIFPWLHIYSYIGRGKLEASARTASFENVQATIALMWFWLSEKKREQAKAALSKYHSYKEKEWLR